MIARYAHLSRYPQVFQAMTGLRLNEFTRLWWDLKALLETERASRLNRPNRQRALGGGVPARLDLRDQLLMTVIWLRLYPTNEVLAYLFGLSDSTVSRVVRRVLPLLAASGNDTLKMPDPGRKHRRQLAELVNQVPELAVVIDSFEQRVQRPRPRAEADEYYSGKKKQHTLKSQLTVDRCSGLIVHIGPSVKGPTSDLKLLAQSGLAQVLPEGLKAGGDLGYVGIDKLLTGRGFTPRRKPRGKPRPAEDAAYNTAFSQVRIVVEHSIGRVRGYKALSHIDRHHRQLHEERVQAACGLANRQIEARLLYYRRAA
jgi:hypothetical protein